MTFYTHAKRWKQHRHETGDGHLYQDATSAFPCSRKTTSITSCGMLNATLCARIWSRRRNSGAGRAWDENET